MPAPSVEQGVQIPFAEIGSSDGEYIRATGYGNLTKGLYLCQHSADLAARVELSKLAHVKVTERSTDRIRERTGKEAEQDIEVVREGLVNEVLSDVRIVDRNVNKEAGTCSSTASIPKRNLFPTPAGSDARTSATPVSEQDCLRTANDRDVRRRRDHPRRNAHPFRQSAEDLFAGLSRVRNTAREAPEG